MPSTPQAEKNTMSNSKKVQRVDAGDMSSLVAAMKQRMAGNAGVSVDASKLLSANNGCSGISADGTVQPATVTGMNITISDLK